MRFIFVTLTLVLAALAVPARAAMVHSPDSSFVSATTPTALTIRYRESNGNTFTTTEALFCYELGMTGACVPGTILGRLPASADRGSTMIPTTAITDVMTIPYSVIRSQLARIAQGAEPEFNYVRRFTPSDPMVDIGAGPGVDVFRRVFLHPGAGDFLAPLSLTRVELYAEEATVEGKVRLVRITAANLDSGVIKARLNYTGTGRLEGWWEVRRPGDPPLQPIDLLTQGALPEAQRGLQQRFLRVKRISMPLYAGGQIVLTGPTYAELPRDMTGRFEILLRIEATGGVANLSMIDVAGESTRLYSGGTGGLPIPALEYYVPAGISGAAPASSLDAHLVAETNAVQGPSYRLAWAPVDDTTLVMEFSAGPEGAEQRLIAPASDGAVDLPVGWSRYYRTGSMWVTLLGPDGHPMRPKEPVRAPE